MSFHAFACFVRPHCVYEKVNQESDSGLESGRVNSHISNQSPLLIHMYREYNCCYPHVEPTFLGPCPCIFFTVPFCPARYFISVKSSGSASGQLTHVEWVWDYPRLSSPLFLY